MAFYLSYFKVENYEFNFFTRVIFAHLSDPVKQPDDFFMYPRVIAGILTINIVASVFREKRPRTRVNHTSVPRKVTQSDYHKVRNYRQERCCWRSHDSLRFLYAKSLLLSWFRSIFTVVPSFVSLVSASRRKELRSHYGR